MMPTKCLACGKTGGWKFEGIQRLPKKQPDGTRIWVEYELWTCLECGSTSTVLIHST